MGQGGTFPWSCPQVTTTRGHRPGAGLFGESIVAGDLKTGQRKWHYQIVHHGIWDMDISNAPILVDITPRATGEGAGPADQAGISLCF